MPCHDDSALVVTKEDWCHLANQKRLLIISYQHQHNHEEPTPHGSSHTTPLFILSRLFLQQEKTTTVHKFLAPPLHQQCR
mmetsp:Transcript_23877/g.40658  ORF Transcript_23877/g.40658 Transcript_23877/m.40658 type:complete len:80 (+) Transcript_23877:1-240(+)